MKPEVFLAKICYDIYLNDYLHIDDAIAGDYFKYIDRTYIKFHYFDIKHVEGYLIEFENKNVLVFRGTDSIQDWIYNLNIIPENTMIGTVHKGFHDSFKLAWSNFLSKPEILNILISKDLYITGHSFGGTLAMLSAYVFRALKVDENIEMTVYTFGSPKVFMEPKTSFHKMLKEGLDYKLKDKIFRYTNPGDIIPSLPLIRYQNVGKEIKLKNNLYNKPSNIILNIISRFIYKFKFNLGYLKEQHSLERYLKNLK